MVEKFFVLVNLVFFCCNVLFLLLLIAENKSCVNNTSIDIEAVYDGIAEHELLNNFENDPNTPVETHNNIAINKPNSKLLLHPCFEKLSTKGRKMIRCKICFKHKNTVLLFSVQKNHIPAICSEFGTVPRKEVLENHLNSAVHKQCVKTEQLSQLSTFEVNSIAPMNKLITQQNKKLSLKIAQLMCTIFNDVKRGTISAWSWPSREVAVLIRNNLNLEKSFEPYTPNNGDLQYINPTTHRNLLKCIVQSDLSNFNSKLSSCLAISLRADGSVDRNQIDNIHVMMKVVLHDGKVENFFMGFAEPTERGAKGYYGAIKRAVECFTNWNEVLKLISSVVTDGATINTGQKNGLWALLEKDHKSNNIETKSMPLIKIWCSVHRSALVWEKLTSQVSEISKLIEMCASITSYFHQSGLRTKELKQIANEENKKYIALPKYFEMD